MKRKVLSLSCLIAAGSLLMGMTAVTNANATGVSAPAPQQSPTVPGMAIGNGSVYRVGTRLTIFSSMASRVGNYAGSVYVYGFTQGKMISVSAPLYNPAFSGDAMTSKCQAVNNITFAGVPAQIIWNWNQSLDSTVPCTISWTITAYKPGDSPGSPTGNVLSASGLVPLTGGQVVVTQPVVAVAVQPQ